MSLRISLITIDKLNILYFMSIVRLNAETSINYGANFSKIMKTDVLVSSSTIIFNLYLETIDILTLFFNQK